MAKDATKVEIGQCDVTIGGKAMGHTKGGVEVTYTPDIHMVTVDEYGSSPVDAVLIGEEFKVKAFFAEWQYDQIKKAIPFGTLTSTTSIKIGKQAGASGLAAAEKMLFRPKGTSGAHDIVIHKGIAISEVPMPHKIDEERIWEVEFIALVDETKSNGNYLAIIGDSTD